MNYNTQLKNELLILAGSYVIKNFGNEFAHPSKFKNSSVIFNNIEYA